ncbi:membrane protein insertion efficiency factor YidD [bacterium NHP-B]|nr:membrane protein insertion efficiency factor YidD [bacterium NHP-B]
MLLALGFYQCVLRSHLWVGQCRFSPTCSDYSRLVIARFGPVKGLWLTLRRLKKCHPWGDWPHTHHTHSPKH